MIVAGKDKGKQGKVLRSFPALGKVIVEGMNVLKRHQRARKSGQKGQIVNTAMPIHASNVLPVDPKSGRPTRVGSSMVSGKKIRVSKRSGAEL